MERLKKPKYDPVWALNAAEDLAVRLENFDISEPEPDHEEYKKLVELAWDISYSLRKTNLNSEKKEGSVENEE